MKRSDYCGKIDESFIGKEVTLYGWVHRIRDIGNLIFIDLRDREGIVQIVFEKSSFDVEKVKEISHEDVLEVNGFVRERENKNPNLKTGAVEILAKNYKLLSKAIGLPFFPSEKKKLSEEIRLKYRYIDLRRERMAKNLIMRSKIANSARNFLISKGFIEVETPILIKSTPEGARDFLVPSRFHKGKFYALPQSPQLFKQILMVAGIDRYFQFAKCFRDEDLRADRQPEFTQIDIEMSFVSREDVMELTDNLLNSMLKVAEIDVKLPIKRLTYKEAIELYGSDKPDLRIKERIEDKTELLSDIGINFLKEAKEKGGKIKVLKFSPDYQFSRKKLDEVQEISKKAGFKGILWFKNNEGSLKANIKIEENQKEKLLKELDLNDGEIAFALSGEAKKVSEVLGEIRLKYGKIHDGFEFLWVYDFPLFEKDESGNPTPMHHPFTSPKLEEISKLDSEPFSILSLAYDIVLNGNEIGGGSIRINNSELQKRILKILGYDEKEIEKRFGFLLKALSSGAPPHGGIALGFDRIIMLALGEESIRDVIAFPKTTSAMDLMAEAPSEVDEEQLKELGIWIKK